MRKEGGKISMDLVNPIAMLVMWVKYKASRVIPEKWEGFNCLHNVGGLSFVAQVVTTWGPNRGK